MAAHFRPAPPRIDGGPQLPLAEEPMKAGRLEAGGEALHGRPVYGAMFQPMWPPAAVTACRTLAHLATLVQLCLYAAPTVLAVQLGFDPDVRWWMGGELGRWALGIPVCIAVLHGLHMLLIAHGRQTRFLFLLMALPAFYLCFVGHWYSSRGNYLRTGLLAHECVTDALHEKARLQWAYEEAQKVHWECELRLMMDAGSQLLPWEPTLQACQEWHKHLSGDDEIGSILGPPSKEKLADWRYLSAMEANNICGGFCEPGPRLWNSNDVVGRQGGRCAPLVAHKFLLLRHKADLVLWLGLLDLLVFATLFTVARPLLGRLGYGGGAQPLREAGLPPAAAC